MHRHLKDGCQTVLHVHFHIPKKRVMRNKRIPGVPGQLQKLAIFYDHKLFSSQHCKPAHEPVEVLVSMMVVLHCHMIKHIGRLLPRTLHKTVHLELE